jgi:predicted aspartyl protease
MSTRYDAFTYRADGRAHRIITKARVAAHARPGTAPHLTEVDALWDTGATGCVVTEKLAQHLNLPETGEHPVTGFGGLHIAKTYLVDLHLDQVVFSGLQVVGATHGDHDFSFIIGMSVISQGDFAFTQENGKSVASFRIPSMETIDFVAGLNEMNRLKLHRGRNELIRILNPATGEQKSVKYKRLDRFVADGWKVNE